MSILETYPVIREIRTMREAQDILEKNFLSKKDVMFLYFDFSDNSEDGVVLKQIHTLDGIYFHLNEREIRVFYIDNLNLTIQYRNFNHEIGKYQLDIFNSDFTKKRHNILKTRKTTNV